MKPDHPPICLAPQWLSSEDVLSMIMAVQAQRNEDTWKAACMAMLSALDKKLIGNQL